MWTVHTPPISWVPISWAAPCARTIAQTIIWVVHTLPISWAAPSAWGTWMRVMGSFSELVPVVVRLIHSPPPLGAASAVRVYRVLAAVVSSLRERTRYFTLFYITLCVDDPIIWLSHARFGCPGLRWSTTIVHMLCGLHWSVISSAWVLMQIEICNRPTMV